jgi:hypothetical protein
MADVWYYADKNGPVGPFTLKDLKGTLATIPNARDFLVWRDGFKDWQRVGSVREVFAEAIVPPPLPKPLANVAPESAKNNALKSDAASEFAPPDYPQGLIQLSRKRFVPPNIAERFGRVLVWIAYIFGFLIMFAGFYIWNTSIGSTEEVWFLIIFGGVVYAIGGLLR